MFASTVRTGGTSNSPYIMLVGIDHCGKGTQTKLLRRWFEHDLQKNVIAVHEPGFTPAGQSLRTFVKTTQGLSAGRAALAFAADRAITLHTVVESALSQGVTVVSDRGFPCFVAYQGASQREEQNTGISGLTEQDIDRIVRLAVGDTFPDSICFIDISIEEMVRRRSLAEFHGERQAFDVFDNKTQEFFQEVRTRYLNQANRWPSTFTVINGEQSVDVVQNDIRAHIASYIQ